MRAPKICSHRSGCTKLGVDGTARCEDHPRQAWQGSTRGQATGSADHRARKQRVTTRDLGLCRLAYEGCEGRGYILDHIRPIAAGGAESDRNTWMCCKPCHDIKSRREREWLQHGLGERPWPDDPALKASDASGSRSTPRRGGQAPQPFTPRTIQMRYT